MSGTTDERSSNPPTASTEVTLSWNNEPDALRRLFGAPQCTLHHSSYCRPDPSQGVEAKTVAAETVLLSLTMSENTFSLA